MSERGSYCMKILLDSSRFRDYTEIHKGEIGEDVIACLSGIITGVGMAIPAVQDQLQYRNIVAGDVVLIGVGGLAFLYGLYRLIRFMVYHYSAGVLYKDVINMNEARHNFSLVAVKDTFSLHPNRFLLHYDNDWNCDLFFSFHTLDDEKDNLRNIRQRLSHLLQIDEKNIKVRFVDEAVQTKFSERDKMNKVYDHRLYKAEVADFPSEEKADSFTCGGVQYKWASIDSMRKDPEIQKKNMDVVDFVDTKIS